MKNIKELLSDSIFTIFRCKKFRINIIELNRSLIIYENDKLAICKVYKDNYIKRYFRNVGNRFKDLIVRFIEAILSILVATIEFIFEVLCGIAELSLELITLLLELIRAIFSFIPIMMIKDYEGVIIEPEFKDNSKED